MNEPALRVVESQTRDCTAIVCFAVLKYLTAGFQVPQFNHLYTYYTGIIILCRIFNRSQ